MSGLVLKNKRHDKTSFFQKKLLKTENQIKRRHKIFSQLNLEDLSSL